MQDKIIRVTGGQGSFRAFIANSTQTVEEARKLHHTSPVMTAALGRLLTAAGMMGLSLENEEGKLTLLVRGDGPAGSLLATTTALGEVKGYVTHPQVEVPNKRPGKLDVGHAIGQGSLTVIRDLGEKEPFSGTVELVSGEIAEDLAYYYLQSEQTPSALALGVHVQKDYSVEVAGGFMIQMLPGADDQIAAQLEQRILDLGPVTDLLRRGETPESLAELLFADLDYTLYESTPLAYACHCSKDHLASVLVSLGKEELEKMAVEDHGAEVHCHFCNKNYKFSEADLRNLIAKSSQ